MKKVLIGGSLMVLLLTSCTSKVDIPKETPVQPETQSEITPTEKQKIFTSFYPMYFLTKWLVWETYEVVNLIPTGGEGHEFEPSPRQIEDMMKAHFVVMNGLGMEHYEEKLSPELEKNKVGFTHLSEKLTNVISHEEEEHHEEEHHEEEGHNHGPTDPHTWLSPKVMVELATILSTDLKVNDTETAKKFIADLTALDAKYTETLKLCKRKELVTSHEAFAYLARDYGLTQVAVAGIEPDMEPSAADIARVIEVVKDKKVTTLFTEPLVSPKFTDTIARETGAKNAELHPLETLTIDEEKARANYITIMEKNLEKIIEGLECK
jgi:zinc transport system substrate-binding protein